MGSLILILRNLDSIIPRPLLICNDQFPLVNCKSCLGLSDSFLHRCGVKPWYWFIEWLKRSKRCKFLQDVVMFWPCASADDEYIKIKKNAATADEEGHHWEPKETLQLDWPCKSSFNTSRFFGSVSDLSFGLFYACLVVYQGQQSPGPISISLKLIY